MSKKTTPQIRSLQTFSIAARLMSGIVAGIVILFLIPLVVPYLDNATTYPIIRSALELEGKISAFIKTTIPTKIAGTDVTRWIVVIGGFMLSSWFNSQSRKFHDKAEYQYFKNNVESWKKEMHLSDNAIILSPLNAKLEQLKTAKKRDREELLKDFVETKRRLDEMGRDLAFLAIDIVDSTGMKEGEERAIVEHDFKEYKRFVEGKLLAHGCLKSTWTPDGVMSAFNAVDAAVTTAREVINGLEAFNKNVKSVKRNFVVRCGVNSGFVYFDDSVPLEEVSDRVIDIAGHMQKNALPNTVCVAKPTIEPLNERGGFEPSGRIVDGYEVYEWKKT